MLSFRHHGLVRTGVLLAALAASSAWPAEHIALEMLEPGGRVRPLRDVPVSVGLVFPKGELAGLPGGRLLDDQGATVPFDAQATG